MKEASIQSALDQLVTMHDWDAEGKAGSCIATFVLGTSAFSNRDMKLFALDLTQRTAPRQPGTGGWQSSATGAETGVSRLLLGMAILTLIRSSVQSEESVLMCAICNSP
jgi:hypothetical protein